LAEGVQRDSLNGVLCMLGAYFLWGVLPVYWKALGHVEPLVILCHRIVWSSVLLAPLVLWLRRGEVRALLRSPGRVGFLALSGAAVGVNWLIYIWSVNSGRILETSLGYFILPLLNVVVGLVFFRERITTLKGLAVLAAASGVLFELVRQGALPMAALGLAGSFCVYGILKKRVPVDPLVGLFLETSILSVPAMLFLGMRGMFGWGPGTMWLLFSAGLVTSLPLWLFGLGARGVRMVTMGFLQFLSPGISFLIGLLVYGEAMSSARIVAFCAILVGVSLYGLDSVIGMRRLPGSQEG